MVFYDTKGDVGSLPRQNRIPGFDHVYGLGAFVAYMRPRVGGDFRVVFHPSEGTVEVRGKDTPAIDFEFDAVCRLIWRIREVVFCVDEIWNFTTPSWMPHPLRWLVLMGRTPGITILYTAQRPQAVARALTALTSSFEIFRIQEPADLDAIRGYIPREALELVPRLQDRERIYRDEQNNWLLIRAAK